tara:strand:+ start:134 stop:763 length:630 start_codon:yes stop_codon:yes gene_type:complete
MKSELPKKIPVFPLSGVIYFPKTNLPLNIFEKRYLDLVNDCMSNNKMMGMVQSKRETNQVYNVGCLGKIIDFKKNDDGRLIINLSGISRFKIIDEINSNKLYREFNVEYDKFKIDIEENKEVLKKPEINESLNKIKIFYKRRGLLLNWKEFEKLSESQKINTLAMISPISNEEKQKLLETITLNEKWNTLSEIIEFYSHDEKFENSTIQ